MSGGTASSMACTWSSSRGGGSVKNHDRIMRLHRLHFAEKKGSSAVQELVEEKRKEACKGDARMARAHKARLQSLKDDMDKRIKNAMQNGSMSVWTQEERDRIEERRRDPDEALTHMTKHMKELARSFKDQKTSMAERVAKVPSINVRPKEELASIEERRQDPEEARQRIMGKMKEQALTYR